MRAGSFFGWLSAQPVDSCLHRYDDRGLLSRRQLRPRPLECARPRRIRALNRIQVRLELSPRFAALLVHPPPRGSARLKVVVLSGLGGRTDGRGHPVARHADVAGRHRTGRVRPADYGRGRCGRRSCRRRLRGRRASGQGHQARHGDGEGAKWVPAHVANLCTDSRLADPGASFTAGAAFLGEHPNCPSAVKCRPRFRPASFCGQTLRKDTPVLVVEEP